MYNFSNEAKERIINGKITRAYLKVLAKDNLPEFIINESNYLKDLTFEDSRYVPNEGFIGGTVAKSVTGNFNNVDNSFSIQDREFELYLGVDLENGDTEYQKYGTFIVQKPEDDQVTDNTSFEALDYMIKLNLPWEDRMTYPCTLKELFYDLVEQSGMSTKVTKFLNEDFIIENNQFEEGTTRRDVLKAIAQVAFNWARIDEDDEIVMDFNKKDNIDEVLDIDKYYNFSKQDKYGPINVIVFRNSQVEGENITIKDEKSINAAKGKNKFNKNNMQYTDGYYLDINNNEIPNENWKYTDYIEVDSYYITLSGISGNLQSLCAYDENKNFIVGANYNNKTSVTINSNKKIKYVRFSVNTTWRNSKNNYYLLNFLLRPRNNKIIDKIQLEENLEKTDFEPFIANGETELTIADNPFAYTQSKRAELIEAGRELFGLEYVPLTLNGIGYIYLNCKDKIKVTNLNNESFETYLINHTIEYNGISSDIIESPAITKTETKYQFTPSMIQALKHTELLVDKANQQIEAIVEEQTKLSDKVSEIEVSLEGIELKVSDIEDLTKNVEANNEILLENCVESSLLELHIYGNNTVFDQLYISDDLFISNDLIIYGDSKIEVINMPNSNEENTTKVYELGITEVLRQKENVYDEYVLSNGVAKVIRRINKDGTIKTIPEEEIIGNFDIELLEGNNIIRIKNYNAKLKAKFAFKNNYTNIFATKVEMKSSITQTAEEINLEVRKKVDENEIISKINQSAETISIEANKISLKRKNLKFI